MQSMVNGGDGRLLLGVTRHVRKQEEDHVTVPLPQTTEEQNVRKEMAWLKCNRVIAHISIAVSSYKSIVRYTYIYILGYLSLYASKISLVIKLVCAKDTYPRGLKLNCKKTFSCAILGRRGFCGKRYKQAMNRGCNNQIPKWLQSQFVWKFCKKSCKRCVGKCLIYLCI